MCPEYRRAKTTGVRKIEDANQIVKAALELIDYFQPERWWLENP